MPPSRHIRRGIYLMPTLFTVANMFCGFSSIVQASKGSLELAAALIVLAGVLDGLDGRVARMTGSSSAFGLQFDSLADIISFGIAPAILAYNWALSPVRIGWPLAFLYVVCAAMRLARFNIQPPAEDKRYFVGLPSPMSGLVLACLVYAFPEPPQTRWMGGALIVLVFSLAMLMISKLRYRSFREVDTGNRRSYVYVLPIAATLVAVALHPQSVMLAICFIYLLSAPVRNLWHRVSGRPESALESHAPSGAEVADEPALR